MHHGFDLKVQNIFAYMRLDEKSNSLHEKKVLHIFQFYYFNEVYIPFSLERVYQSTVIILQKA